MREETPFDLKLIPKLATAPLEVAIFVFEFCEDSFLLALIELFDNLHTHHIFKELFVASFGGFLPRPTLDESVEWYISALDRCPKLEQLFVCLPYDEQPEFARKLVNTLQSRKNEQTLPLCLTSRFKSLDA
eukprot:GABV01014394.1.p1 GENE.GABV01014394.1~~GABV01014394.1.p1  ORF type:complete len:139 (-),score=36.56 GABV01014394.1:3-395(-)